MSPPSRAIPSVGRYDPDQGHLLAWMMAGRAQAGDLFRGSVYRNDVIVVCDPRYVEHILRKNWQNYTKGLMIKRVTMLLGPGLMSSQGELWKTQRRLIQPAFQQPTLDNLRQLIVACNRRLRDRWAEAARSRASVNITHDISQMVLELGLRSIFGEDYERVATHFALLTSPPRNMSFARAFRPLHSIVSEVAARRATQPRAATDFLGLLMAARDRDSGQTMTPRQLAAEILTLIVAGHETTSLTLNWCWYLLATHPAVETRLAAALEARSEAEATVPAYVNQVIDETMRLFPAGWLMTRKAIQDDYLDDRLIPAGSEIYISPYVIQRHPNWWPEPDRFAPERFAAPADRPALALLPFSAGPRNCIGEHLARLEMQLHVLIIGPHLRLRRQDGDDQALDLDPGVNLRNKHDFIMRPVLVSDTQG